MIEDIINKITEDTIIYIGKQVIDIDIGILQALFVLDEYDTIKSEDSNDRELMIFVCVIHYYDGGVRYIDERNVRYDYVDEFMEDGMPFGVDELDFRNILRKLKIDKLLK